MQDSYPTLNTKSKIKIIRRYKFNKWGDELVLIGFTLLAVTTMFYFNYAHISIDHAPPFVHISLIISILIVIFANLIKKLRKYKHAILIIESEKIIIEKADETIEIPHNDITKFEMTGHSPKTISFKILSGKNEVEEIKTPNWIYNGLIENFPSKE